MKIDTNLHFGDGLDLIKIITLAVTQIACYSLHQSDPKIKVCQE